MGSWYLQSLDDFDAHRGTSDRGRVNAVCGISFEPLRSRFASATYQQGELETAQLCPECAAAEGGERDGR